jgi:glycosyltransferase involved in cell wall biosynthesis
MGFDISHFEELYFPQIEAGVLFLKNNSETRRVIDNWLSLMEEGQYRFLDDSLSPGGELPSFIEHRHDQSILTSLVLAENFGLAIENENFFPELWAQGEHPQFAPIAAFRSKGRVPRMESMKLIPGMAPAASGYEIAHKKASEIYEYFVKNPLPRFISISAKSQPVQRNFFSSLSFLREKILGNTTINAVSRTRYLERYLREVEDQNVHQEIRIWDQEQTISDLENRLKVGGEVTPVSQVNRYKISNEKSEDPLTLLPNKYLEFKQRLLNLYWGTRFNQLRLFKSRLLYLPIDLKYRFKYRLQKLHQALVDLYPIRLGILHQYSPRPMQINIGQMQVSTAINALPKISIVTPSFEQAIYLERTIDSILSQNYPHLEYFIQDGGSQDGTLEILEKYRPRLTGFESAPDHGQAHAINLGFEKTSGEIMAWINSDDVLLPNTLNIVGKYFADHPEVDVVYGNRLIIDEHELQIGHWIMPPHDDTILSWADYIPQETLFWRRSLWEKSGAKVDEGFSFAMDWDLLLRFRDVGARFSVIPKYLACFRVHSMQKTSALISQSGRIEMNRLRKRNLGFIPSEKDIWLNIRAYLKIHQKLELLNRLGLRK